MDPDNPRRKPSTLDPPQHASQYSLDDEMETSAGVEPQVNQSLEAERMQANDSRPTVLSTPPFTGSVFTPPLRYSLPVQEWTASPTLSSTPSSTPSLTPSSTPSSTPSLTPSSTPSLTPSSTPSSTPSLTPSSTPSSTPSLTPSSTPSPTPSLTPSSTPSPTPSSTLSSTLSPTPSSTLSSTLSPTPSSTPSPTLSPTPSLTPSSTPSLTPSPLHSPSLPSPSLHSPPSSPLAVSPSSSTVSLSPPKRQLMSQPLHVASGRPVDLSIGKAAPLDYSTTTGSRHGEGPSAVTHDDDPTGQNANSYAASTFYYMEPPREFVTGTDTYEGIFEPGEPFRWPSSGGQ